MSAATGCDGSNLGHGTRHDDVEAGEASLRAAAAKGAASRLRGSLPALRVDCNGSDDAPQGRGIRAGRLFAVPATRASFCGLNVNAIGLAILDAKGAPNITSVTAKGVSP